MQNEPRPAASSGRNRPQTPLAALERTSQVAASSVAAPPHDSAAPNFNPEARTFAALRGKTSIAEFNTAIVHFYRGEVQRANVWRNRLDTTTNWAVLTAGATLSFAFSSANNPHFVIIINSILIAYFLIMEARRYRYYEIWSNRIRIIETHYFAQLLTPEKSSSDEWTGHLSKELLTPHFTISEWEAIGRRLRRNYWWIFLLLALSWNLKVYIHPMPAQTFDEFLSRAAIASIPGTFVFAVGVVFNMTLLIFGIATIRLREATGEILPHYEFDFHPFRTVSTWTQDRRAAVARRTERARARVRARAAKAELRRQEPTEAPQNA
jgi:uncharacterized membrane protein